MKKVLAWLMLMVLVITGIPSFETQAEESGDQGIVISVLDYGADPTGESDSTDAIWAALQAAKEAEADGNSVTLDFPEGEYHIYKDHAQVREYHTSNTNSIENPEKTIGILIEEHENLTIDGNGSLFMMHGNMMALAVVKSKNITLKDFSWDFAVPTVVEMTVAEVGSNYTDYYIPDCFPHTVSGSTIKWSSDLSPYTGEAYWSGSGHQPDGRSTYAVVGYHPDDEMSRNYYVSDGPLSNVSSIEELSDNYVRVYYSSRSSAQTQNQKEGTVFELCGNAHRETAGAFTWESENVTVEEVNVHFMHGFGWLIQMSKDVYYRKCNLVPRENSGHITVSFADGIHASGAAGELVFEDCNFANTHDDPLNLHGTFTRVESRNDDNTLTLKYIHAQQGGFPQYHVGDKVQFFTRDTLESTDGEAMYTVAEIVQDTDESSDLKTMIVRFEETLPENLSDTVSGQPKYVAENVTYAPAVTIRNCTFRNVATRGVLCTTRNKVLIENNVFYNMSMATIYLSNDSDEWYESGPIRDMTIRNNIFYIKDIGRTAWNTAPAIYVHPVTKGGGLPDASNPIHKNITIEGNTFYMDLDRVVEAESVENLTFRNNKVYRLNPEVEIDITLDDTSIAAGETTALTVNATGNTNNGTIDNLFQFKACKNVVIEGNTYDDGLKLCAVVDQATLNNGITVNDDEITVGTSATAVADPVTEILYASSDASVAKVDANGNITGVSAGTATVFAYYECNDTMIRSNYVEVTVEGEGTAEAGTAIEIVKADGSAADNTEVNMKESATVQFAEKDGKEVTWSVVDFETEAATTKASISADGTLTATEEGVVWVKAVSADGAKSQVAVVIYGADSYGVNDAFSVTRGNENHSFSADSIKITAESGSDLWQWDNTLKNLILYTPEVAGDNLRVSVKVDNLPVRESNKWDTASLILYAGDDDYYTIGKKSHYDGFATVAEIAQSATEAGGSSEHNDVSTAWLGFSKVGNTITLEYSLNGQDWNTAGTFEDSNIGNDYKIGFGAWGTTREVTFSEFKVGTADQEYTELEAVELVRTANERPAVSNVSVTTEDTTAAVSYTYTDADAEGTTYFRWTYEENGNEVTAVTTAAEFSATGLAEISCQVYPVDACGTPGTPSEVKKASFASENTADLYSVAFGNDVVYRRHDDKEATVRLPEEVTKVEMTYVSVNNLVGGVTISKNGTALEGDYANSDSVVLEVADGDVIVITRGGVDYTFTVECVGTDVTAVEKIAIEALDFEVVPEGETEFFVDAEYKGSGTIVVTADENAGTVEILYGTTRDALAVTQEGNIYSADYRLVDGLNSFYVQVTAKDGITTTQYMINIVYDAPSEPEIKLSNSVADDLKAGAVVGELAVVGMDEDAVWTYTLCEGSGDADNAFFTIKNGQLKVKKALTDGESYQIRIKAVSGDSVMEAAFVIRAQRARTDYPVENTIAISDSQYLPGTSNEGPDDYILDGDASTHWHTNWQTTEGTDVEKRWVGVSLAEATEIDAIRYLPRTNGGTNGAVTEYKAQYRATDDGEWIDLATGTWSANDTSWKLITFDAVVAKQVRVVGVHTYADSGNDAHMSCAEFRVTIAEKEEEPPIVDPPVVEDDEVVRIAGAGRIDTGLAVADTLKDTLGLEKFETVIIATSKTFADALPGSYLAYVESAPILLISDARMDDVVAYVKENLVDGGKVYILGGEAAVSTSLEGKLEGYDVDRLAGSGRYETNMMILDRAGVTGGEIIVATGKSFADSLSASAAKLPILMVKDSLNVDQKALLATMNVEKFYIVGGESAVSAKVADELAAYASVERVAGANRRETSIAVAQKFFENPDMAVVASASNFPDGLCGGPLAAALDAPLVLTVDGKTTEAAAYTAELGIEAGYVLGGTGVLTDDSVVDVFALESADEIIVK